MKQICTRTSLSFLQVINKPIIFYQLEFLERQGIKKVKLLIDKDDIASKPILDSFKGKIKFDIIHINTDKLNLFEVIRERLDHNNFILIEGDSILSFDMWKFIENHLNENNLLSLVLQKQDSEISSARKSQVGSGDRSEKIRTYNYPQGRITDHRIGMSIYQMENFLNGDIDEMVDNLIAADRAEKLKGEEE